MTAKPKPLDGLVVLDLTQALSGPFATLLLAGLGARVIKVEAPGRGDLRDSSPFVGKDGFTSERRNADDFSVSNVMRLRGKESITLDFKAPEAAGIFADLVARADVVAENFSRGTAERIGVGYAQARAIKPDIVYCSLSGFGQQGAAGEGKAYDPVIQALSGIMLGSGRPDDPPARVGPPVADLLSGVFAVVGILAAVHQHRETGVGQLVDVSMLGPLTSFMAIEPWSILEGLGVPIRSGPTMPRLAPFGAFQAKDGWVVLCAPSDHLFADLARVMDRPVLREPRFAIQADRLAAHVEVEAEVTAWTSARTVAEVLAALEAINFPCAPVRTPAEGLAEPTVLARGEVVELRHPDLPDGVVFHGPGVPITFSEAETGFANPAPRLGADNEAVYGGMLGYSEERLAELRKAGVI